MTVEVIMVEEDGAVVVTDVSGGMTSSCGEEQAVIISATTNQASLLLIRLGIRATASSRYVRNLLDQGIDKPVAEVHAIRGLPGYRSGCDRPGDWSHPDHRQAGRSCGLSLSYVESEESGCIADAPRRGDVQRIQGSAQGLLGDACRLIAGDGIEVYESEAVQVGSYQLPGAKQVVAGEQRVRLRRSSTSVRREVTSTGSDRINCSAKSESDSAIYRFSRALVST